MTNLIDAAIDRFHLLKHPFYQAWMKGEVPLTDLRDYAKQYYSHVDAFPRYLSAIHSMCESTEARKVILENLNDEEGINFGTSHPELWLRFAEGLGVSREEVLEGAPRVAVQKVMNTFFGFARSSFHEGLGALYAYESQVPEVAHSKIAGLKDAYGIHDARTLEFFEVHKTADKEHRASLKKILDDLPEGQKREASAAASAAAESLWDFLSDVYGPTHRACELN
jgi:pyrroloquinoline-quinone synthase